MTEHPIGRIRCLVVDDQALIRSGFRMILESDPGLEVVGEAANGAEAINLAHELVPDVILMDIRMPLVDGIDATRTILADPACAGVRVLILTTFELDEYVYNALRAGASGFLLKDTDPDDLIKAVYTIAEGDALLAPSVTRRLVARFADGTLASPAAAGGADCEQLTFLTEREREVLELVGQGLSNTQIAEVLFISPATAKTHVSRVMMKCDAHDRAQLVVLAYESGLVVPGQN